MLATLKHQFIANLVIHGRLKIADILLSIGLTSDVSYQLCAGGVESHKNLFFKCD